ncbi:hypothetical protein VKT23_020420 [Stygiomarasmius scandens]|uniref:Fe2OG dioxygenase domain-containing protein n=1 Tax=Marasmiellus scandens TaxID=2682957 RepID=A0ABR1IN22_9AGAR
MICSFYDALVDGGFRFPPDKLDRNRSATSGAHLGVWSHYSLEPMVSSDSRLTTQKSLYVINLIDEFLQCLKDVLVPVIRAHRFVKTHFREGHHQEFEARISLDFGGAFFCTAIKEGGSEIYHLDFHDDPDTLTWIIPLGEGWEGGEFCLPQLGFKIPLQPGQVLGALTRRLIHCSAPANGGRRLVLTLFCDKWIMKHSEEWVEY